MAFGVNQLSLAIGNKAPVAPTAGSYRPPSWPPPKDWVCIEDGAGNVVSRWGDQVWNLWPWAGEQVALNFGDGPQLTSQSPVIDPTNADLLRLLVTWRIWGPRGARSARTVVTFFSDIRKIIALCSANQILASDLSRFPAVIEQVATTISASRFDEVVAALDRLRDARELLGFELIDQVGLQRLKAAQPDHAEEQTGYIPPRIWTGLVMRLKECLDDYIAHQVQIEECFAFCVKAYARNRVKENRHRVPFQTPPHGGARPLGIDASNYLGPFADTAYRFGIKDLLERWVGEITGKRGIQSLTSYLNLIQHAGLADVLCFTLMRVSEGASLRENCLVWHDDPVYGRIPLIQAETTKTDPDDSALWVTSPSVQQAIRALTSVAKLRLSCSGAGSETDNPYLLTHSVEPWRRPTMAQRGLRYHVNSFSPLLAAYPKLFDARMLTITDDDLRVARAVTPTLNRDLYQVGKRWPLAWHQFRRTGAVNMFASGTISDSSMQLQMKHLTRLMPLYYGRGNSTLHLNDKARVLLVNAQYEAMGRQLAAVHTDRYISPYGDDHKAKFLAPTSDAVHLISHDDALRYERAARQHQISFRQTVLGGCMKNGQCDGDCVSSVGDCAGDDSKAPCINVLFDRNRAEANQIRLDGVIKQLELAQPDTPRYRLLEQERRGLENYFAHINRH